jgi:hypothetical protein
MDRLKAFAARRSFILRASCSEEQHGKKGSAQMYADFHMHAALHLEFTQIKKATWQLY